MSPVRAIRIIVNGRVQGVGFRAWTQHQAELRDLKGWVRNRRDGTVEVMIAGPSAAVESMLQVLAQGPATGRVDGLELAEADQALLADLEDGAFEVRSTV